VKLTSYSGEAADITAEEMQRYISLVEEGKLKVSIGRVFPFENLVEAHKLMDANKANGKIVVTLS
jgi:NADPH:quinone reductase